MNMRFNEPDRPLSSAGTHGGDSDSAAMRLQVASKRLTLAAGQHEAALALLEIGSNLIGCEQMAVLSVQKDQNLLCLASAGMTEVHEKALRSNSQRVVSQIEDGRLTIVSSEAPVQEKLWSELGVTAFVPVWHHRKPRGAIVFYSLLPQRNGFDEFDRKLLEFLSWCAGPPLFSSEAN